MSKIEKHIEYYSNGKKKLEGTNKGLLWDGLWTKWYEHGQKGREITFKDGELISEKCWN